jgi:hypothetical protein
MVSLTRQYSRPRHLVLMWVAALLAPFAWSAALGMMFSLTNETCMSGSRFDMLAVAITSILLAAAPAVPVVPWRKYVETDTAAGERTRLLFDLAVAGSLIFALVMVVSTIPILFLDSCRA